VPPTGWLDIGTGIPTADNTHEVVEGDLREPGKILGSPEVASRRSPITMLTGWD
jgi:hypothetical protein